MASLFTVFGLKVTAYAVGITVAAATALVFCSRRCARMELQANTWGTLAVLVLPLGLICARLFYCLARIQTYLHDLGGIAAILRCWEGGYALWGALFGAVLTAVIAGKITRQKTSLLLDALAPSLALFVMLERFSEYFDSRLGYGMPVRAPFLQRFPFAVFNTLWWDWMLAICAVEGLAALAILFVLLRKNRKTGDTARLFFVLYSACQIVLESMRRDSVPKWLFVRVYQLTAVIVLTMMMIAALIRWARNKAENRMKAKSMIANWAIFAACVGIVVAMEFAVDGKTLYTLPTWCIYGIMVLCCAIMGFVSCQIIFRHSKA